VLMFDLDNFKKVNDTHGTKWETRCLKAIAESVSRGLRPVDL